MKRRLKNAGFSLVELLISMALLSIIMVMVVQFMSTTTAASRKTKANLKAQTTSDEMMGNITDAIANASYVRIGHGTDSGVYVKTESNRTDKLSSASVGLTKTASSFTFDLVSDNYGEYIRPYADRIDYDVPIRRLSCLEDEYTMYTTVTNARGEKEWAALPLSGDMDSEGQNIRSFRCLKKEVSGTETYLYVKPEYLYVEYCLEETSGTQWYNVIYHFDYSAGDGKGKVYMSRGPIDVNDKNRYEDAVTAVSGLNGKEGLLTDNLFDLYVSADAEGAGIKIDSLVKVDNYYYNAFTTSKVRSTHVMNYYPQSFDMLFDLNEDPDAEEETSEE